MVINDRYKPITVNQAGDLILNANQDRSVEPGAAEDDPTLMTLRARVKVSIAAGGKEPTRELEDEIIKIITGRTPYGSDPDPDGELTGG